MTDAAAAYPPAMKTLGVTLTQTDAKKHAINKVNTLHSNLAAFMASFRGVSTKHLQSYLQGTRARRQEHGRRPHRPHRPPRTAHQIRGPLLPKRTRPHDQITNTTQTGSGRYRTPCGKPAAYTAEKHRSQSGRQLAKTQPARTSHRGLAAPRSRPDLPNRRPRSWRWCRCACSRPCRPWISCAWRGPGARSSPRPGPSPARFW